MCAPKLCCFLLILTSPIIQSREITFRNVTLSSRDEKIATITQASDIKEYLPNRIIEYLVLTGRIPILHEDSVAHITNIKEIHFHENGIEEIRPHAFRNSQIECLKIAYSDLVVIRQNVFSELQVKELTVSHNSRLETIEEDALDNSHIEVLVLNNNSLSKFPKNVFRNIPNLKWLLLRDNRIEHIQSEVFDSLPITNLDLSGNYISTIPSKFICNLKNLVRIFFDSNRLTTVPSDLFSYHPALQEVSLPFNQIHSINPDAFDNMPHLRNVTLALNNLTAIDNSWFRNCPRLTKINLVRNFLEEIPDDAFKNLNKEERLSFRFNENKIKRISPSAFRGLKRIESLSLSDNLIEKWSAEILADAEFVGTLDLIFNKIECPEGDLRDVFVASVINLGYNPLSSRCLEKIEEWRVKESDNSHRVCIKLICSV